MAARLVALLLAMISLLVISSFIRPSEAAGIAVYWGQNGGDKGEGSLVSTCLRGTYKYVNLAFLEHFGGGQTPKLNLSGHCELNNCSLLSSEIHVCQNRGIQVLLSLGGAASFSSVDDARNFSTYLWNNFLGGNSGSRPLGDAVLDGIDFHIDGGSKVYLDDLARELSGYRNVRLSAAPRCQIPDSYLEPAIRTGKFDYVWVQFYDNPSCQYTSGGLPNLIGSWDPWARYPEVKKLFLGLPAAAAAAPGGGYIAPDELTTQVLPLLKGYDNYGGVMLWNRYWDENYSLAISPYVSNQALTYDHMFMIKSYATE